MADPAMDDSTIPNDDGSGHMSTDRVPDPHLGEPLPPEEAGVRPEAVASGVRPEQDEPGGPLPGLVAASAAEIDAEVTDDPEAESLLAQMGVEDEGIESGQLLGLMLSILVGVAILTAGVIYLLYQPYRSDIRERSEDDVRYEELADARAEGLAQISQYQTTADGAYAIPIGRAMGAIAAQYDGGDSTSALPETRQSYNLTWIDVVPPRAVEAEAARGARTAPVPVTGGADAEPDLTGLEGTTDESVGVDDPEDVDVE